MGGWRVEGSAIPTKNPVCGHRTGSNISGAEEDFRKTKHKKQSSSVAEEYLRKQHKTSQSDIHNRRTKPWSFIHIHIQTSSAHTQSHPPTHPHAPPRIQHVHTRSTSFRLPLCNGWKERTERPNVGGVSIRSGLELRLERDAWSTAKRIKASNK